MISIATSNVFINLLCGADASYGGDANERSDLVAAKGALARRASASRPSLWNRGMAYIWRHLDQRAKDQHYANAILRLEDLSPHLLIDVGFDYPADADKKARSPKFVSLRPDFTAPVIATPDLHNVQAAA